MEIYMQMPLLSPLLNLVLSVGKVMLPIEDLMVDGGCIGTTGGRRLFYFMDAGSGINLIYAKTLRVMHISLEFLKHKKCSLHGIVPGSANYPLGHIALNICFGNCRNYR
jgi:hypothetical protein